MQIIAYTCNLFASIMKVATFVAKKLLEHLITITKTKTMRNYLLLLAALVVAIAGCKKENKLTPKLLKIEYSIKTTSQYYNLGYTGADGKHLFLRGGSGDFYNLTYMDKNVSRGKTLLLFYDDVMEYGIDAEVTIKISDTVAAHETLRHGSAYAYIPE